MAASHMHLVLLLLLAAVVGVANSKVVRVPKSEKEQVDSALQALDSDGQFTSFLTLLQSSNNRTIKTFKSLSALTLFAPTDDAFADDDVQDYLGKLTKQQTLDLLKFHGLPKYYSQNQLEEVFDQMIRTVASGDDEEDSSFQLVIQSDYSINTTLSVSQILTEAFDAFPVVVYVVNKVLIPVDIQLPVEIPPPPPVVISPVAAESLRVLKWSPFFRTLINLLNSAEMIPYLESLESFTLFAPIDRAFQSLSPKVWEGLSDKDVLTQVLKYHVVPAYYPPWFLGFIRTSVPTLASSSGDYQLRFQYLGGLRVVIDTGVSKSSIVGVVFHRKPVVIYSVQQVFLPKEIFG